MCRDSRYNVHVFQIVKDHEAVDRSDWFRIGDRIGLEIVEEEEVEAEVEKTAEDREVERIFNDNKTKQRKMLKGRYINLNVVTVVTVYRTVH